MSTLISIAFPFQVGESTFPKESVGQDAVIKSSIIQIIITGKRERVMRPSFGCSAFDFVFEPDTEASRLNIEREVRSSLATWEPRVRVDSVEVTSNHVTEPGQILISIYYTVISSNTADSVTIAGG